MEFVGNLKHRRSGGPSAFQYESSDRVTPTTIYRIVTKQVKRTEEKIHNNRPTNFNLRLWGVNENK